MARTQSRSDALIVAPVFKRWTLNIPTDDRDAAARYINIDAVDAGWHVQDRTRAIAMYAQVLRGAVEPKRACVGCARRDADLIVFVEGRLDICKRCCRG